MKLPNQEERNRPSAHGCLPKAQSVAVIEHLGYIAPFVLVEFFTGFMAKHLAERGLRSLDA